MVFSFPGNLILAIFAQTLRRVFFITPKTGQPLTGTRILGVAGSIPSIFPGDFLVSLTRTTFINISELEGKVNT
jgi:hypothetical protein